MPIIVATMLATLVSGALLLPGFLYVRLEWDIPWRLASDARIGIAALHLVTGFFSLMILGGLWSVHMRSQWRHHLHRRSGLITSIALVLLAATGAGIYYLSGEDTSLAASVTHVVVGILFGVAFGWHALAGHRRATRSRAIVRGE